MTPTRPELLRPRAIAVPHGTVVTRLAWSLAGFVALALALTAQGAVARSTAIADARLPWSHVATLEPIAATPEATGRLDERHAIPQRITLRTPERSRRTAGRAGTSVRRDVGDASAVLPAGAGAPQALEGGSTPFGAVAAAFPPARGPHAHGVRGPPSLPVVAG